MEYTHFFEELWQILSMIDCLELIKFIQEWSFVECSFLKMESACSRTYSFVFQLKMARNCHYFSSVMARSSSKVWREKMNQVPQIFKNSLWNPNSETQCRSQQQVTQIELEMFIFICNSNIGLLGDIFFQISHTVLQIIFFLISAAHYFIVIW